MLIIHNAVHAAEVAMKYCFQHLNFSTLKLQPVTREEDAIELKSELQMFFEGDLSIHSSRIVIPGFLAHASCVS